MNARLKWNLNPIIVKELRSRMRGPRAFLTLTGMLLLLGVLSYWLYRLVIAMSRYSGTPVSPQIGQVLFAGLVFLELIVICGLTPAVTAGAISGEREKQTYEMLLATPLRPASILWGKLVSALSYVALLVFAAVPMASLVFIFGGVTPWEMVKALVVLIVTAVMVGVIGLFNSALFGRTSRSTVVSYVVILLMLFGPLFAAMASGMLRQAEPARWLTVPSPIAALFSALAPSMRSEAIMNLFYSLGGGLMGFLLNTPVSFEAIPRPIYHYSLPFFGALTLVLYLLATRLVRPVRRWRLNWKEAAGGAAVVAAYAALIAGMYWVTSDRYESPLALFRSPQVPGMVEPAVPEPIIVREAVIQNVEAVVEALPPAAENAAEEEAYPAPGIDAGALPDRPGGDPYPAPGVVELDVNNLSLDEKALLYATVIRQVYTVDHTFGQQPEIPVIYLLAATDDRAGSPDTEKGESQKIPDELQKNILAFLLGFEGAESDRQGPPEFRWIASRDEVTLNEDLGNRVADGGAIITLGNLHVQADGTLHIPASIYFADLTAGGRTYVLEKTGRGWQITGTTGPEWMS